MWSRNCLSFRNILAFGQLRTFDAHNPNALKTEGKKMSNPLKTHQNTLVSHPAPKLPGCHMWSRNCLSFRNILAFGQLRTFVVSHELFLKIQGGQAVFIFI
jgi:hypothetical protein